MRRADSYVGGRLNFCVTKPTEDRRTRHGRPSGSWWRRALSRFQPRAMVEDIYRGRTMAGERPVSEAQGESDLRSILEELEEVVVLVTLFMLGEVREVISGFELRVRSEGVREPDARVH